MKANRTEGEPEVQLTLGSLLAVKAPQCNHANWFVCPMECAIDYSLLDKFQDFGTTAFSILNQT